MSTNAFSCFSVTTQNTVVIETQWAESCNYRYKWGENTLWGLGELSRNTQGPCDCCHQLSDASWTWETAAVEGWPDDADLRFEHVTEPSSAFAYCDFICIAHEAILSRPPPFSSPSLSDRVPSTPDWPHPEDALDLSILLPLSPESCQYKLFSTKPSFAALTGGLTQGFQMLSKHSGN